LVPTAWHRAHASGLAAEADARRAATHGASARSITLASRVRTTFFVATGAWVILMVVLPMMLAGLVSRMLYG
ncbi:MAG: hypothetical protein M3Y87_31790, partial [Myxococcota bacterium]|nr:hypothetical protein [Myxococcota bacterium]